jgi:hypothetical protein
MDLREEIVCGFISDVLFEIIAIKKASHCCETLYLNG